MLEIDLATEQGAASMMTRVERVAHDACKALDRLYPLNPDPDCVAEGSTLFVPVTVVLELEWVLRSSFEFGKDDVLITLSSLFSAAELSFESDRSLEVALQLFRKGSADFADCLHVALAARAGEQPLWTFDKAAAKVNGARLLTRFV